MNIWLQISSGWLLMAGVMTMLWFWQKKTGNAGIVDVAWGLGVGGLACLYCYFAVEGNATRRIIVSALAMFWATRLSGYVWLRGLNKPEDGRYREMKQRWQEDADWKMFRFFQYQAAASVIFSLPMLIAAHNPQPISWLDWFGILVGISAVAGESLADWQLATFRSNPINKGEVCSDGLWRYSRHPNYFFEWLHWWSYVCLALGAPLGWLNIIFPMAMLVFILFITGIPPTEAQAIKSRGDKYREYQRTTSPFVPIPPR